MPVIIFSISDEFIKLRLLLTRPRKDAQSLQVALKKIGIQSVIEPLIDIHVFGGQEIDCQGVAALAVTSSNGVRAFVMRSRRRDIPLYAVGDSTASTARNNGFSNVRSASGTVDDLAALITSSVTTGAGEILHPAASHVAGDLEGQLTKAGLSYRREIIYKAISADHLSPDVVKQIQNRKIHGLVLFSPRTGYTFKTLVEKGDLIKEVSLMKAYCLSSAVARSVRSLSWLEVRIADQPNQTALLEMLAEL